MFPKPQVKKVLTPRFVEARLHTDLPESHPHYKFNARIQEVRTRFLGKGNIGLPHYIVVDPLDPYKSIVKLSGSLVPPAVSGLMRAARASIACSRRCAYHADQQLL